MGYPHLTRRHLARIQAVYTFLLVLLLLAAPSSATEKVVLQLAWKHQFQFAGYYAALHKGFYQRAGLDVTIVEGGEGRFAREEVLSGRAHYGVAGAELILHRRDGDPFVVLAPIFQHSPSILLVRRDSGISNLQDLIGKRVMLLPGKKDADILAAFLYEGISLDAFQRLDQTYNLSDLVEGRTDAVSAYVTNEPWYLSQQGIEPMVISPQTYGVDFYSDCLFSTEQEIKKHQKRVHTFLNASLRGWEYAMAHPEEIIDLLLTQYSVEKKRSHLKYEAESIRKIMLPELVQVGHMNPGRWHHIAKTYEQLGLIDPDFSFDGFWYDPKAGPDYAWLKQIVFAGIAIILLLGAGAAILLFFNRKLVAEAKERKLAEKQIVFQKQKAEQYLNLAGVIFIGLDTKGNVNLANEKACAVLECSEMDILGKNWFDNFLPRSVRDEVHLVFDQLIKGDIKPVEYYKNEVVSKKGHVKSIAWHNTYISDDRRNIIGILSSGEDITEKKKLQAQLQQAQKMESIGNLAGGIAHDFNNILSSVIGFTELALIDVEKGSRVEGNLQEVFTAGKRARDLVKQILAFARQSDETLRPLQPGAIAAEVLKFIRSSIPTTIKIKQALYSDALIMGNATQMHQVLMNLCTNAAYAMEDKGGILEVTLMEMTVDSGPDKKRVELKPGDYIEISISDTGTGIPPHIMDSIFEPYFTTKGPGEGTGMGLAMAQGIIESYGGKITVDSVLGKGSTFTVYLPIVGKRKTDPPYQTEDLPSGSERILFVDDEPPLVKMQSEILGRLGYSITSQTSSRKALYLFKSKPDDFDLVITDMTMPEMTGDVLAAEMMAARPDIPIILCTGYSKRISDESADEIGVKALIYKPIVTADLAKTIRKVLDEERDDA